jgi:threonine dehydrogenase-like Zn-dependent dehydrogenase
MQAFRIKEIGKMERIEVEVPRILSRHVLLKVNSISICGTDVHELEGRIPVQLPRIPGHDFAGTVVEVGPETKGFKEGDRVAVKPSFPCYACEACKAGFYDSCPNTKLIGLNSDGCFREIMAVPEANLIPMRKEVSFEAASVLEPFTVGLNAFMKLKINIGESVAILGQGPIGLGLTRIAALSGAGRIFAADIREDVLEVARKYGATDLIHMAKGDGKKQILDLSGGGTDVVIETAGSSATVAMIPELVKKGGKVVNIGIFKGIGAIPIEPIVMKALTIIGVGGNGGKGKYETALDLTARGLIDPTAMVTHRLPFKDAARAFELAQSKIEGTIKVVVSA